MDSIAPFLGLALRAGRLAVGEEPVGTACRTHKARLLLLASDAADNTIRRALRFSQAGTIPCLTLSLNKEALGACLGRASCAMLAVTDAGFAAALAEKLAKEDPQQYGQVQALLSQKAARMKRRRKEKRRENSGTGQNRKSQHKDRRS